jgi:RNA polymerase subunit RPABC4/transcription elongation factor Spt4
MSTKCSRCGATLSKKAKFCTVCGTPVSTSEVRVQLGTKPAIKKLTCSNCGKVLKGSEKFCTGCGMSLVETAPSPPATTTDGCPNCGFAKNPPGSNYCINCGQILPNATSPPEESAATITAPESTPTTIVCPKCGQQVKGGSKFCRYCGSALVTPQITTKPPSTEVEAAVSDTVPSKESKVESIEPIAIPSKILASLMARGRQLVLEDEYAENGTASDQLLDELSQAASESNFELEDLIDTYINERAELERLEALKEKGEVSDRVYERLTGEYDEKLERMDEQIQAGARQLQGYHAQIQLDYAKVKDELETLNARILIGDEVDDIKDKKTTLTEKTDRLNYALIAAQHILQKESTLRNGPLTRFEVKETTVTDSKVTPVKPEKEPASKDSSEQETVEASESGTSSTSSQPDVEAGKICTQCGRITSSDARFCVHCGAPL